VGWPRPRSLSERHEPEVLAAALAGGIGWIVRPIDMGAAAASVPWGRGGQSPSPRVVPWHGHAWLAARRGGARCGSRRIAVILAITSFAPLGGATGGGVRAGPPPATRPVVSGHACAGVAQFHSATSMGALPSMLVVDCSLRFGFVKALGQDRNLVLPEDERHPGAHVPREQHGESPDRSIKSFVPGAVPVPYFHSALRPRSPRRAPSRPPRPPCAPCARHRRWPIYSGTAPDAGLSTRVGSCTTWGR
jgi:hypothetical protein